MIVRELIQKKEEIRKRIESQRRQLSQTDIATKSRIICDKLVRFDAFQSAETIHSYVAWRNEVNTHELIKSTLKEGRRVVVPVVDLPNHALLHSEIEQFEELQPGTFGILEPPKSFLRSVPISDLDLIIVPGVAFDLRGDRIGYGGGYYDRFLRQTSAKKVALAYHFQIVDQIPTNARDQSVDIVVTEKGVFEIR